MLLRMQIPACSHGGSHFALGSKTNPTATPRGASEPAEQTPRRATKAANSIVERRPTKLMVGFCFVSQVGRGRKKQTAGGDGGEQARRDLSARRPRCCCCCCCTHGHYNRGSAGGVSWRGGLAGLEIQSVW